MATAAQEDDLDVMRDILNLPKKHKEVILLYYWQDMNVSEIARALGVSQSTVSRRLERARNVLRGVLERRGYHA